MNDQPRVLIRPGQLGAARGEYNRRARNELLARKRQLRDENSNASHDAST